MPKNTTEPVIQRPSPSWSLSREWRHRGRHDVHGHRETTVEARFSSNEDHVVDLPNEITVRHTAGESRSESIIRMPREAGERLIEQLQAALEWDGR